MKLTSLNYPELLFIASNMRQDDRREIFATRFNESNEDLARDAMMFYDSSFLLHKERPICAIGAAQMHPNVWSVWMFATDEFDKIGLSATRFVRNIFIPELRKRGHRAECKSWDGHKIAHKWLESLGAIRESELIDYGKNREKFYQYVWRN